MKTMMSAIANRVKTSIFEDNKKCFALTLLIHMQHSRWCTKGWLEYVEHLESELEVSGLMTCHVVEADHAPESRK